MLSCPWASPPPFQLLSPAPAAAPAVTALHRGQAVPVVKWGLAGCSCTGRESVLEAVSWAGRETVAVAGDDWALERGLCPAWMVGTMGESAKGCRLRSCCCTRW